MQNKIKSFNYFKINAVKVVLQPLTNSAGTNAPPDDAYAGGKVPPVYILWEPNISRVYSVSDVASHPNSKMYSPFRRISTYRKMRGTAIISMGSTTDVDIMLRRNFKISTEDIAAPLGKICYCTSSDVVGPNPTDRIIMFQQFVKRTIYYLTLHKII